MQDSHYMDVVLQYLKPYGLSVNDKLYHRLLFAGLIKFENHIFAVGDKVL